MVVSDAHRRRLVEIERTAAFCRSVFDDCWRTIDQGETLSPEQKQALRLAHELQEQAFRGLSELRASVECGALPSPVPRVPEA